MFLIYYLCRSTLFCVDVYKRQSVGTEELNHIEMVCTIVHQLTRNLTVQQIKEQGFADYYVDHTTGIYPVAASGTPWSADTRCV